MINTNLFCCLLFLNRTILCGAMHDGNDDNQSIHLLWLEFLLSLSAKFRYNLDVCARTCANGKVSNRCFFFGDFVVAHVSMSALTSDQISCTQIKSIGFFAPLKTYRTFEMFKYWIFFCTPLYLSLSSVDCQIDSLEFRWKNTVIEAM